MYRFRKLSLSTKEKSKIVYKELLEKKLKKLVNLNPQFAGHAARIGAINQLNARGICLGFRV